jgi:hypothetical protein
VAAYNSLEVVGRTFIATLGRLRSPQEAEGWRCLRRARALGAISAPPSLHHTRRSAAGIRPAPPAARTRTTRRPGRQTEHAFAPGFRSAAAAAGGAAAAVVPVQRRSRPPPPPRPVDLLAGSGGK